ncbi:heterokaryon incompatibility protein-domain-containing protein [Neofusicoccum parvum]|nr:heterokaryon incompatibility protein-domain-containing protein [Neofusicoccum parvum]
MAAVVLGAASAAGSSEGIAYSPNPFKDFVEAPAHWADSRFFGHGPIFIGTSTSLDEDRAGPLYTRGWTFQERLLAARYVHIGEQQVFFECNHGRSYQQHGDNPFRHQLTKRIAVPSSFNDWHQLVQEYSRRILSVPSDNLIAVGGVAKYFSTRLRTPSAYLAGLWRANLVRDLSWHVAAPSPQLPIAPSWSWASRRTEVVYKGLSFHFCGRACAAVVEDAVRGEPNAFGHRVSGRVVIRASLRKIFVQGAQNRFCVVGFQAPAAAAAGCADGMPQDELLRVGSCVMDSPAGGDDMASAGPRFSRYGIEGWDDVFEVWALQLHPGRGLLLKPTCAAAAAAEFERVGYYEYADRRHDSRRPEERGADRDPLSYAAYLVDHPFRWMEEAVKAGDEDLIEDWFGDHDAVVTLV